MAAGEKVLRVIIAGDALGAVSALESLSHGLERAHKDAEGHGGGILSGLKGAALGVGVFAAGAVAAAGIAAEEIFKISSSYEQNLNAIQAFTHSTDAQMKQLENQLYSQAPAFAQMGQTVSDASEALYELTKAGATAQNGMTELTPTMALAKATNTDYAESAKEMTRMLNAFGLQAKDSTTVADVLTNATHTSTQTLQDMADGLKYVSVAAHDYGVNLQTTAGVMAMYANAGISGTNAGTAFRQMLLNLSAPTTKGGKAIEALGLKAFNAQGQMLPLGEIFQQLQDKFGKGLDTHSLEKIAPYLKDIFGARGVEPILAAIRQGGGGLQTYIDLMKRTGEASAIAQAKSKGLSGTFNMLRATIESAVQHLYMKAAPRLAAFLDPFVESLPRYMGEVQKFASSAMSAFSGHGPKGGGSGMTKVFAEMGNYVRTGVVPALHLIGDVVRKDVVPIVRDLGHVFLSILPFAMRIGEGIAKILIPILRDVAKFVTTDVVPSFRKLSEWFDKTLLPKLEMLWSKIQPILAMLGQYIQQKIVPLLDWAWKKLQPLFVDLGKLASDVISALSAIFSVLKPVLSFLLNFFGGPVIGAAKGFFLGVIQLVKGVIEVLRGLLDFLGGLFTGNWSKMWDGVCKLLSGAFNTVIGLFRVLIFGKLLKWTVEGFEGIYKAVERPIAKIVSLIRSFCSNLLKDWRAAVGMVKLAWEWLWKSAEDETIKMVSSIWKGIVEFAKNIYAWFKALPGEILGFFRDASKWLVHVGSQILVGLIDGLGSAIDMLWKWATVTLPNMLWDAVKGAATWLFQAGVHLIEGLIKGIESMASKAMDSVGKLGQKMVDKVTGFFGINSPSRVFHQIGVFLGQGLINGVNSQADGAQAAVLKMMTVPASKMQAAFQAQQQRATRAALSAAHGAGQLFASAGVGNAAPAGSFTVPVTVNVAGSVHAERDLAKSIAESVRDQIRQIGRQNGGRTGLTGIS